MQAKIMEIGEKVVVIKDADGKFLKVPKSKLTFDYKVGSWVTLERNGEDLYVLPEEIRLWDNEVEADGTDILSTIALVSGILMILSCLCLIIFWDTGFLGGGMILTRFSFLAMSAVLLVISSLCRNFSKTQQSGANKAAKTIIWCVIVFFLFLTLYYVITEVVGTAV